MGAPVRKDTRITGVEVYRGIDRAQQCSALLSGNFGSCG
jgi:hypothetical protein